jgi:hypothetical protein
MEQVVHFKLYCHYEHAILDNYMRAIYMMAINRLNKHAVILGFVHRFFG